MPTSSDNIGLQTDIKEIHFYFQSLSVETRFVFHSIQLKFSRGWHRELSLSLSPQVDPLTVMNVNVHTGRNEDTLTLTQFLSSLKALLA
jgi:hypothetical protein